MGSASVAATIESLVAGIAGEFRRRMLGEYAPRIRRCVDLLGEDRCWQRPAPNCNSVGNLLLHLCGNITQWILVPFDGETDRRDRPREFASNADDAGATAAQLIDRLEAVVTRACAAVDRLDAHELLRTRTIQQRYQETGLAAVLHVLEHCSGHAGQIYAWTKQATRQDLKFYDL